MIKTIHKLLAPLQRYFSGELTGKKFIPGIAWFFILLALLCWPGEKLPDTDWWLDKIYFDKWVHTGLFGLLAALFMAPVFASDLSQKRKWLYVWIIAIAIIAWALATEFIQHTWVPGRSFDLFDWMADTFGTILAVFLSKYFFWSPPPTPANN